jgi:TPR repeat protein
MAQGDASFANGEVSVARFYYQQAVDAGDAEAAVRIGETFDPAFLTLGRPGRVVANREAARFWYRRALDLGAMQAQQRLDNLQTERAGDGYTEKYKFRRRTSVTRRYDPSSFHKMLESILHSFQKG